MEVVRLARSIAIIRPAMVTRMAACFAISGIVIIGDLIGSMFDAITSPEIMLPQARRLIGFITVGLFSLIGERGLDRG